MVALIKNELVVGITTDMKDALEVVCAFQGIKPSQFGRMAIIEKLTAMQMMKHPGQLVAEQVVSRTRSANAD
jgi:hypothetical protein